MPVQGREAGTHQDYYHAEVWRSECRDQDCEGPGAEGQRVKRGTQAPGPQLPSYARSLLVSTSTSVGGQGAAKEGTAISIHLGLLFGHQSKERRPPGSKSNQNICVRVWGGTATFLD